MLSSEVISTGILYFSLIQLCFAWTEEHIVGIQNRHQNVWNGPVVSRSLNGGRICQYGFWVFLRLVGN